MSEAGSNWWRTCFVHGQDQNKFYRQLYANGGGGNRDNKNGSKTSATVRSIRRSNQGEGEGGGDGWENPMEVSRVDVCIYIELRKLKKTQMYFSQKYYYQNIICGIKEILDSSYLQWMFKLKLKNERLKTYFDRQKNTRFTNANLKNSTVFQWQGHFKWIFFPADTLPCIGTLLQRPCMRKIKHFLERAKMSLLLFTCGEAVRS